VDELDLAVMDLDGKIGADHLALQAAIALLGVLDDGENPVHLEDIALAVIDAQPATLAPGDLDDDLGRALLFF
jgi:hypothetical protein